MVDRKKDLARKYCFDNSLNGLRKGPDGIAKVTQNQLKAYHHAVAGQSKKKSTEPMKP